MKLLKFSEEHYILADKLDINVGDWITDKYSVWQWKDDSSLLGRLKVTHSTEPIEFGWGQEGRDIVSKKIYNEVNRLSLSEVKELLGAVDVKKKAEEFYEFWYDKYGTSEVDTIVRDAVFHGFRGGYNQFLEDNKEKKYTEENIRAVFMHGFLLGVDRGEYSIDMENKSLSKYLQPAATEWDVEIIDGKLKLK